VNRDALIVGGGAAGFFAAIHLAEARPEWKITILEKSTRVLSKVRISGGGRCNVTHAAWEPQELARYYPRGHKELLGPFHRFSVPETMAFFEGRNVPLKIEEDGRVFPQSDSSESIVDCLTSEAARLGVEVRTGEALKDLHYVKENSSWEVVTGGGIYKAPRVLLATGSSPGVWNLLSRLGHDIVSPVPSLFTFRIRDPLIDGLQGLSTEAELQVQATRSGADNPAAAPLQGSGPVLVTHRGLSGPAVLRLSAWGARELHLLDYQFFLRVDWIPDLDEIQLREQLVGQKEICPRKSIANVPMFGLPRRLWRRLLECATFAPGTTWSAMAGKQAQQLIDRLKRSTFQVDGKDTFKEEFVTAGGVDLRQVDFRTFQSRRFPGLYFAGEVLDIDALTGGFNFQNAWTGAWHAARAMASPSAQKE